jgi:hypothetical protein
MEIISIKSKGLWNHKPFVTEGSQVVGRPPLVSEAWFMAQVLQSAHRGGPALGVFFVLGCDILTNLTTILRHT